MKKQMKLSVAGYAAIKLFEGLRLTAYKDQAGIWTIGYGSTYYKGGARVKQGDKLPDQAAADDLFRITMQTYEAVVNQYVKVDLNQNEFDALVSFTYNTGPGALASSHLLIYLNENRRGEAADQFLVWDKITNPKTGAKEVCEDLLTRRKRERLLFIKAA